MIFFIFIKQCNETAFKEVSKSYISANTVEKHTIQREQTRVRHEVTEKRFWSQADIHEGLRKEQWN